MQKAQFTRIITDCKSFNTNKFKTFAPNVTFSVHSFGNSNGSLQKKWSSIYTKSDVQNLIKTKGIIGAKSYSIVDVREPIEVHKTGKIETSINVPMSQFEEVMKLPDQEFKVRLGARKPQKDELNVFYCAAGVRAAKACLIAEGLGYKNVANYEGSAKEWFTNTSV